MITDPAEVLAILGQQPSKNEAAEQRAVKLVREGFPASVLERLARQFGVRLADIQELVGISKATGTRSRGRAAALKVVASDRAYRLASILSMARGVFGDDENAREWFKEPVRALGGERPIDLLDTEIGTQKVVRILGRIRHGIFS